MARPKSKSQKKVTLIDVRTGQEVTGRFMTGNKHGTRLQIGRAQKWYPISQYKRK